MRPVFSMVVGLTVLAQATACVTFRTPGFMKPAPERAWAPTLERARQMAARGEIGGADSVLAAYAAAYPRTRFAVETYYWRPLLQLQADIPTIPASTSVGLLSMYALEATAEHRVEAEVMRRAVLRVDSLSRIASSLSSKMQISNGEVTTANARVADAKADAKAETKDQEAEIRRLKDELAKSKEELERIKKRLSEPPAPKKPPR